jgi:hypothetical protein
VPYAERARTTSRRVQIRRTPVAGLLVVIAAIAAVLGGQLPASSSSTATSAIHVPRSERPRALRAARSEPRGPLGEADGAVPDGTTVFDDEVPGVANLDPALLGGVRQAATNAAPDGVEFYVESGWRSAEYQAQLHARSKDAAVMRALRLRTGVNPISTHQGATMSRTLRPLTAFAMVALISAISAGCGSNAPAETGTAISTGTAGNTGAASNKRATDQDKIASPSSAGSSPPSPARLPRSATPPSPAGRLPYAGSKDAAVASALGIGAGVNAITTLGEKA